MGRINISELVVFNTVKGVLTYIREDWKSNTDKTQTFLYDLWNGVKIGANYDCYSQVQELFLKEDAEQRVLDVRLFFDAARAPIPTIHITLPSETGGGDGIGVDVGYEEPEFDDVAGEFKLVNNRMFNASYNIVISSDNSMEVVMIYHTLRAALISAFEHIELAGLRNPKLSGGDLNINSDLIPPNIFMRVITISAAYDIAIPQLFAQKMAKKIILSNTDNLVSDIVVDLKNQNNNG